MLYIADFFNVDVGYLIGETDSKLFDIFDTGRFLGLSNGAIEQIMRITNSIAKRPLRPITQVSRLSFEHLLCSDDYFELIIRLREMYSISPVSGVSDHNKYDCYEEVAMLEMLLTAFVLPGSRPQRFFSDCLIIYIHTQKRRTTSFRINK